MVTHGRRRRRYGAVERNTDDPYACHGEARYAAFLLGADVTIAQRMDDGSVALHGDDEDVEGRRHEQCPQRHGVQP